MRTKALFVKLIFCATISLSPKLLGAEELEAAAKKDLITAVLASLPDISGEITYEISPGPKLKDYLLASDLLSQIRGGHTNPSVNKEKIEERLDWLNFSRKSKQHISDGKYYVEDLVRDKYEEQGYRVATHIFDGKQYIIQTQKSPRWDIMPYRTWGGIFYNDFLGRPIASAGSGENAIGFSEKTYYELLENAEFEIKPAQNAKKENVYRLIINDTNSLVIDKEEFRDVYEVDFEIGESVKILKAASYRLKGSKVGKIDSDKLTKTQKTECYFSGFQKLSPDEALLIPTEIVLPVYGRFVARHSSVSGKETKIINTALPGLKLDEIILLCEHRLKLSKVTTGLSDKDFKPELSEDSFFYNHLTKKYEEKP
ncbi:MAG: hypothetical protein AAF519_10930 [Bacteroidota bacterium]